MINYELDLVLLRLMCQKDVFIRYSDLVDVKSLSTEGQTVFKAYVEWYKQFNVDCDYKIFVPWFFDKLHADWLPNDQSYYKLFFSRILGIDLEDTKIVVEGLQYRALGAKILKVVIQNQLSTGDLYKIYPSFNTLELEMLLHDFNNKMVGADTDIYTHDFNEIYGDDAPFLPSRLKNLNMILGGGYEKEAFALVVAGRDAGKSAFCISEAVNSLQYIDPAKQILYFKNEQSDKKMRQRLVAALINRKPIDKANWEHYIKHCRSDAARVYNELGGNRIQLINITGKSLDFIINKCRRLNPGLIFIDQVDPLAGHKVADEDGRVYANLYSKIRLLSQTLHVPIIGCTQASGGGYTTLKDGTKIYKEKITSADTFWSQVDKQANVDTIIGLGISNQSPETGRFINIDRDKNGGRGFFGCTLIPHVSRFID